MKHAVVQKNSKIFKFKKPLVRRRRRGENDNRIDFKEIEYKLLKLMKLNKAKG